MGFPGYYLIGINLLGFILFAVNTWLYAHTANRQIDSVLTIVCLLGGSAGILLSMLIFDRRVVKENMMSRVFIACVFVIQLVLLLVFKGHLADHLTLDFRSFFERHRLLIPYLLLINIIAFVAYAVDKAAAIRQKSRIKIVTLLGLAFIGGSAGSLIAMYLFRHKTKKDYFTVGVPLMMLMQLVVLLYAVNAAW